MTRALCYRQVFSKRQGDARTFCERYGAHYDSERRTSTDVERVTCEHCLSALRARITLRLDRAGAR